jgi:ABC-type antimicrobial peptide transport system permease subunit
MRVASLSSVSGLDTEPWSALLPALSEAAKLRGQAGQVISTVTFLIAAVALLNTMFSAVFERKRELATLMAIGMSPGRVRLMIMVEAMSLVLLGGALGVVLGLGISEYLEQVGVSTGSLGGTQLMNGVVLGERWYGFLRVNVVIQSAVTFMFIAFLAAVWAGFRASRSNPIEAMR